MTRYLALIALAGCTPDAPSTPSFQQDVLPILAANCIRCHGYPAIGGAPQEMRLDSYTDVAIDDATSISGAMTYAPLISVRVSAGDRPMPPRFPLEDHQVETLQRWADAPERGMPRPGNRIPDIEIEETSQVGARMRVVARVRDPDGDVVAGELRARIAAAAVVIGPLKSGRVTIDWDTSMVAPGTYAITAYVDDGADVHAIDVGNLDVGGL